MRLLRSTPEIIMWLLIIGVALLNVAIYTGVVEGENVGGSSAPNSTPAASEGPAERALAAEHDDSASLPGTFVPTQGRQHTDAFDQPHTVEFCAAGTVNNRCYASNPPSSGLHLPVERGVRLANGEVINIPPDPGIYVFEIPRESIPHLQEHAGVYVGYHCASAACWSIAGELASLVDQQLDLGRRVVLAPSSDLPEDTIGMASWTRFDVFPVSDYDEQRVARFIEAHSCRFDPEGFCG
jgi:hypothetical protein